MHWWDSDGNNFAKEMEVTDLKPKYRITDEFEE